MTPGAEELASTTVDTRADDHHRSRCPTCGQAPRRKRQEETSDEEYFRSLWRMLNAYDRRTIDSGLPVLADIFKLHKLTGSMLNAAVARCLSNWQSSWAEIGQATNRTRTGAQRKWGYLGAGRPVGGQPGALR